LATKCDCLSVSVLIFFVVFFSLWFRSAVLCITRRAPEEVRIFCFRLWDSDLFLPLVSSERVPCILVISVDILSKISILAKFGSEMLIVPIAIQLVLFCTRLQGTASWFLLLVWKLVRQLCRLVASSFAIVRESIVLFVVRRSSSFCRVLRKSTWFFSFDCNCKVLEHRAGRVDLFELGIRKAGLFDFLVFRSFGVSDPVFRSSLKKNFRRILSTLLRLLYQQEWT
jgi:hypothetical protein